MKGNMLIRTMVILCVSIQSVVAEGLAVPLKTLVKDAEVVAYVHRSTQKIQSDRQAVRFDILRTYKGTKNTSIDICNSNRSSERYDLNGFNAKEMVVFLRTTSGSCFSPIGGLSSTIIIVNGIAHTLVIRDQPPEQSLDEFANKILGAEKGGETGSEHLIPW